MAPERMDTNVQGGIPKLATRIGAPSILVSSFAILFYIYGMIDHVHVARITDILHTSTPIL